MCVARGAAGTVETTRDGGHRTVPGGQHASSSHASSHWIKQPSSSKAWRALLRQYKTDDVLGQISSPTYLHCFVRKLLSRILPRKQKRFDPLTNSATSLSCKIVRRGWSVGRESNGFGPQHTNLFVEQNLWLNRAKHSQMYSQLGMTLNSHYLIKNTLNGCRNDASVYEFDG